MTGFLGFAPIYVNGLLAILFVLFLPGLVLVRAFDIPNVPQRWLAVLLGSLTFNHLFVVLIALLHLDPLVSYRAAAAATVAALLALALRDRLAPQGDQSAGAGIVTLRDIRCGLLTLAALVLVYINIWKHGVPHVFGEGDVSISWNRWALLWSQGLFPTGSYGYPQLIPTLWSVTYIFTGSTEQYFAYYLHIGLLIFPIVLTAMVLGRGEWWKPAALVLVFAWFVAEIQDGWLRASLQEGYPDWGAAISALCGAALFIANAPDGRFDRDKIVAALLSLCLLTMAATTKPLFGLIAIAVLTAICIDAARNLGARDRNRFLAAAVGLFLAYMAAYALVYANLAVRSMPNYPVSDLSDRLARALSLFNRNFTLPFRILAVAGLLMSPFLPRVRWLALPLFISISVWANTASYDLRNVLGPLAICAFIPVYAAARAWTRRGEIAEGRRWTVSDAAIAAGLAAAAIGLSLPLAVSDQTIKQRFADEQIREGSGREINEKVGDLLRRGCTVLTGNAYLYTISAFLPFKDQLQYSTFGEPIGDPTLAALREPKGCTAILYVPSRTHASVLNFITAGSFTTVIDSNGTVLATSN
ncbi:hypothetical protein [Bradyrhizobium sp.]|uniref:hypothetical protein n=1 Tax=Bradyrhizobium sp. TaxID=376 RepID=UPI0027326905|nr:hypothetical protein [Bradyrhizobium sp.]MDP3691994.1 hypothetical protein [Bradyrhizobium sp.]